MELPGSCWTAVPSALVITQPALPGFGAMLDLGGADHCSEKGPSACRSVRGRLQVWECSRSAQASTVLLRNRFLIRATLGHAFRQKRKPSLGRSFWISNLPTTLAIQKPAASAR